MWFYSESGGFLPDRVSTLEEVVSLHLKVPSSQLLSLQMKSQLAKVQQTHSSKMVLFTCGGICMCCCHGWDFTGENADVAEAALSCSPA